MYPNAELARLDAHKSALRLRIAVRRLELAVAAGEAGRPIAWLDRAVAFVRSVLPLAQLAAIPAALLAKRTLLRRPGLVGRLVRWGPVLYGAGQAFAALRRRSRA